MEADSRQSRVQYSQLDKMLQLERDVRDLQLLNEQQSATIKRLTIESQAKSAKLAELLANKAVVTSDSQHLLRPSLQVTSHVTSARFPGGPQGVTRPVSNPPSVASTMKLCETKLVQLQQERNYWRDHYKQSEEKISQMKKTKNSRRSPDMSPLQEVSVNKEPESLYLRRLLEENLLLKDKLSKQTNVQSNTNKINEGGVSEKSIHFKENLPINSNNDGYSNVSDDENINLSSQGTVKNKEDESHQQINNLGDPLRKKVAHLAEHNKCLQHQVCRLQAELLQKANKLACCCQNTTVNKSSKSNNKNVHFAGSLKEQSGRVRNCEACSKQLCRSSQNGRPVRFEENLDLKSVHLCEHIKCLQRQVCHLKLELEQMGKKMPGVTNLRSKLKQSENEINLLSNKCDSLLEQKKSNLDKIGQLQKQVNSLLASSVSNPEGQVQDLIKNIESQRDNYKTHVEKLIKDLQSGDRVNVVNELITPDQEIPSCSQDRSTNQRRTIVSESRSTFRLPDNTQEGNDLQETRRELEISKTEIERLRRELASCLATLQHYRVKQTQTSPIGTDRRQEETNPLVRDLEKVKLVNEQQQVEMGKLYEEIQRWKSETEQLQSQLKEERRLACQLKLEIDNQKSLLVTARSVTSGHEDCQREISGLRDKVKEMNGLRDKVLFLERQLEQTESTLQKCQQLVSDSSNRTYEVNNQMVGLRQELSQARKLRDDLQLRIDKKEELIRRMTEDKDEILTRLEETRVTSSQLQTQLSLQTERARVTGESSNHLELEMSQIKVKLAQLERRLSDRELEIDRVRNQLGEREDQVTGLKLENDGLRREIVTVKDELEKLSDESSNKSDEVAKLQGELKRYVNEVTRIEEVLSMKETDRRDLLRQYEDLSREMGVYESTNRSLEMQAANLQIEVRSREDDLKAVKARCDDLENYLEEILQQNEQFRLQVVDLNSKLDLLTTDLKGNRITRDAVLSDLDSVNELAVKLNTEKVELVERIGQQNAQVENLQGELVNLREELLRAMGNLEEERHRAKTLQGMVGGRETVIRNREVEQEEEERIRQEFTQYTEYIEK